MICIDSLLKILNIELYKYYYILLSFYEENKGYIFIYLSLRIVCDYFISHPLHKQYI